MWVWAFVCRGFVRLNGTIGAEGVFLYRPGFRADQNSDRFLENQRLHGSLPGYDLDAPMGRASAARLQKRGSDPLVLRAVRLESLQAQAHETAVTRRVTTCRFVEPV